MVAEEIKKERERFVAFAFAAAEIFFEIDYLGVVAFEGGASDRLSPDGKPLVGRPFLDVVHDDDREFLSAMLSHISHKGRMGPLPLRFKGQQNADLALRLFALQMPSEKPRTFIALRSAPLSAAVSDNKVDPATGLFDKDNFLEMAAKTMQEDGGNLFMTAVQVDGLQEAREAYGDSHGEQLLKRVAAHMRSLSVDGSAAGQIGDAQFAFLHRGKEDGAALSKSLSSGNPKEKLATRATTIKADSTDSEGEVIRTLGYVLQKFMQDPENCSFDGLAAAYDQMATETSAKMTEIRAMIEARNFNMVFQPVVRLDSRDISHHEVLSRFDEARGEATADVFKFVEDVGLIEEFDLALVMKGVDYIRKMKNLGTPLSLALNISGRSLDVGTLGEKIIDVLLKSKDVARNIVIELTETKIIQNLEKVEQILARLKEAGYRICLDDFGAGASGYQYLRVFNVDMVKIEGSYISEMNKPDYRPTFLMSMVRLCEDLKVEAIGEHIETKFQADFLKSLGVKYGQGYYFARPTTTPQTRV